MLELRMSRGEEIKKKSSKKRDKKQSSRKMLDKKRDSRCTMKKSRNLLSNNRPRKMLLQLQKERVLKAKRNLKVKEKKMTPSSRNSTQKPSISCSTKRTTQSIFPMKSRRMSTMTSTSQSQSTNPRNESTDYKFLLLYTIIYLGKYTNLMFD